MSFSIQFPVTVKLPPYLPNDDPLPETVYYRVWAKGTINSGAASLLPLLFASSL